MNRQENGGESAARGREAPVQSEGRFCVATRGRYLRSAVPVDEFRANYTHHFRGSHYMRVWAERYLRYLEDGGDLRQSRDTVAQALPIGDLSIALLPGEILHLTSVLIRKEFPGRKLIVAGYTNILP
jgi:hypothetical protein